MKAPLHCLAIVATLACGAGLALAQDDEPAAKPEATTEGADTTAPARARRGRPSAARRIAAARHRQALAHVETDEAARVVPPAPQAEPAPSAKSTAHDSGVDGSPAPLDALPGIGAVHEPKAAEAAPGYGSHGAVASEEGKHGAPHGEGPAKGHDAHSAISGGHAGFSGKTFALQLINFGVLLFLLIWFGGRAMNKSLRARHEQLKGEISEAARLRDEAALKFQAQEQRLADLEKEIATLRTSLRQDAERVQARLIEGAQERAKRIQEEMRLQLHQQVKEAESLLRAEVASASVKLAEELVRKSVNTDDERRLAREFVAGFDGPAGPAEPAGPARPARILG